jgi:hypothetical protein
MRVTVCCVRGGVLVSVTLRHVTSRDVLSEQFDDGIIIV